MRVLMLDHTADLGGAEIAMVRALGAIDQTRFEVEVLLFAHGPLEERLAAIGVASSVLMLPGRTNTVSRSALGRSPVAMTASAVDVCRQAFRVVRHVQGREVDLLVANSLKAAVITSMVSVLTRVPWCWHLHDRLSSDYLPSPAAKAMRWLARHGPRRVVANSSATRELLEPIDARKVSVAYPGLPESAFRETRDEVSPPVIGILGRLSPTKGQREFLEAAAMVAEADPDVRFRVIGSAMFNDHAYAEELHRLPERLGIADRVEFIEWTADPLREIDALTVLVHASPVPEPFGQVIVEGVARSVPVIATTGGGVSEILDPNSTAAPILAGFARRTDLGQLVIPEDISALAEAMSWVLEHPYEAKVVSERAYLSASERFLLSRTVRPLERAWYEAGRI